jgi:hypothetical protein
MRSLHEILSGSVTKGYISIKFIHWMVWIFLGQQAVLYRADRVFRQMMSFTVLESIV